MKRKASGRLLPFIFVAALLATPLFATSLALAQGAIIGLSGSFYRQTFEAPQGSRLGGPSIFLNVSNQGNVPAPVQLVFEAPANVSVIFSEETFTLAPGEQKKVFIEIVVVPEALPGEYTVGVFAEPVIAVGEASGTGAQVVRGVGQEASLRVIGSSATVHVQARSTTGEDVVAVVRLFRVGEDGSVEVASSETGTLDARVVPGTFIASAFVAGDKIAEETFEVGEDEDSSVELAGATIYFAAFDAIPRFRPNSQDIDAVEVFYGVSNLIGAVSDARIVLSVTRDGVPLDDVLMLSLSQLSSGQTAGERAYSPAGGWESGEYSFRLELYSGDIKLVSTLDQVVTVAASGSFPVVGVVAGGAGAVVLLGGGAWVWLRMR